MASRICTRPYAPSKGSNFKDQLYNWCDRVHISHIKFNTAQTTYRDDYGHLLFQAVPIFPSIRSTGTQCSYDERVPVMITASNAVGWGTSKKDAEEKAAEALLMSGQYCFY